jgi:hypothetical protein
MTTTDTEPVNWQLVDELAADLGGVTRLILARRERHGDKRTAAELRSWCFDMVLSLGRSDVNAARAAAYYEMAVLLEPAVTNAEIGAELGVWLNHVAAVTDDDEDADPVVAVGFEALAAMARAKGVETIAELGPVTFEEARSYLPEPHAVADQAEDDDDDVA